MIVLISYFYHQSQDEKIEQMENIPFFKGFPHKGEYMNVLERINQLGKDILETNKNNSELKYIIFDIDNTLMYSEFLPIIQMIDILHVAKELGYNIVLLTSRHSTLYEKTILTCNAYNIYFDVIFMRPKSKIKKFKSRVRKLLEYFHHDEIKQFYNNKTDEFINQKIDFEKKEKKMTVLCSFGDDWEDVEYNLHYGIKLPDPYDNNSYIIINNKAHVI